MSHVSEALVAFRAWAALTASNNSSAFSIIGPLIVSRRRSPLQINAAAYICAMRGAPRFFESRDRMRRVRRWCAEFDAKSGQKIGPTCGGMFWKVPLGKDKSLDLLYLRMPLVSYSTLARSTLDKGAKHQHSSHIIHPTARVSSRSCAAALQQLKPINSCGKLE